MTIGVQHACRATHGPQARRLQAVLRGIGNGRLVEREISLIQVLDVEILERDGAPTVAGQVDRDERAELDRAQVVEARDGVERAQVDHVFAVGEVGDRVASVAGVIGEGVGAGAARQRIGTRRRR